MENESHDLWLSVIARRRPRRDRGRARGRPRSGRPPSRPLRRTHPHVAERVQDNYYGMAVFSRLPIRGHEVRYLVDEETPSIRTAFGCAAAGTVRPPRAAPEAAGAAAEPGLGAPGRRARARGEGDRGRAAGARPWSAGTSTTWPGPTPPAPSCASAGCSTRGSAGGCSNTYNAGNPIFRFPLDHVFHSNHFRLFRAPPAAEGGVRPLPGADRAEPRARRARGAAAEERGGGATSARPRRSWRGSRAARGDVHRAGGRAARGTAARVVRPPAHRLRRARRVPGRGRDLRPRDRPAAGLRAGSASR